MSKRKKTAQQRQPKRERHFVVRGVRRDPPDLRKLGRALLSLAQAEAERQTEAEHKTTQAPKPGSGGNEDGQRSS